MGHRIAVLNAGRLQQLGTPIELYEQPANLFVAQFIGSPPMNLLPVEVLSPDQVLLAGKRVAADPSLAGLLQGRTGQQLTLGLRPERLQLAPAANRNLPAEVLQLEALGHEQLISCRLLEADHTVQLRTGAAVSVQPGDRCHLEIDAAGWNLFDSDGDALRPQPAEVTMESPDLPTLLS